MPVDHPAVLHNRHVDVAILVVRFGKSHGFDLGVGPGQTFHRDTCAIKAANWVDPVEARGWRS